MRRAAEDRAGAVAHQHEIGDHDRQLPVRIERMGRRQAGVVAQLLGLLDLGFGRADAAAFGDEGGELGDRFSPVPASADDPATAPRKLAPNSVSGRVVNTSSFSPFDRSNWKRRPSRAADPVLLHQPDFFRPAVQRVERRPAIRRRNAVILKNHCDSLRRSTSAPERQPRPSITCSLASTVMSTGSQFTSASLR